ncbi:MAG: thiol-disulfide isomerase/thioredoxin [Bacteroidia bacterium]|jgi:thiol-disulfide isomerase/thioredoxin
MKFSILLVLLSLLSCTHTTTTAVVNFDELQKILSTKKDKLVVVNFWATWCPPCVAELPHFMEVNNEYADQDSYEMILVSLDKASDLETSVRKMIDKLNITTDAYILDDNKRMNEWIPAIDAGWSGAIPATVFYKNNKKVLFVEGQMTKEELKNAIEKHKQ